MLPVSHPSCGQEELEGISRVLNSGWLGQGATVIEFEQRLASMLGGRHVVAVNTGTSALHLALDALGIGPGDEVIVPSLTFCGSVQAITALDATPVFCEVEMRTLCLDVEDARRRITPRTRAIMPVHYGGNVCEMDSVLALARAHGFAVVEDAAHAFGSTSRGRLVGSFGDLVCFSFDPIKNITCGEGGAVALADGRLADLIRRKRTVGINRDGWQRTADARRQDYEVNTQGYRYHMSNINAAIGLAQIPKLAAFRERKCQIVRSYNDVFGRIKGIQPLRWDLAEAFPFAYVLLVRDGRRDALRAHLAAAGVGTGIHYIPNHLQPHFARFAVSLPVTERVYGEILTLPLFCDMSDADVDQVIDAVTTFFASSPRDKSYKPDAGEAPCR